MHWKVFSTKSKEICSNLRKKQKLYINDGTYGTLFDAGTPNIVYPSKMIKDSSNKIVSKKLNIDPALASSVFVTTITDVIGFLSFLGLGSFYFLN